jgi:hypothetical protein
MPEDYGIIPEDYGIMPEDYGIMPDDYGGRIPAMQCVPCGLP